VSGHDNGKYQVRMNIYTPKGSEEWKNVEITGYAKVVRTVKHPSDADSDLENVIQWYARSGEKHRTLTRVRARLLREGCTLTARSGGRKRSGTPANTPTSEGTIKWPGQL
jgi:hypothetical protein